MNGLSIREYIAKFYPEYYSWNTYPAAECAPIGKTADKWGVLGNFYQAPIEVNGTIFNNTEQLFQMMKFKDQGPLLDIYTSKGMTIKMKSRKWQNQGYARADWGQMIVDAMKFCLLTKHQQCKQFREELQATAGLYIIEDETTRKNTSWGTKLIGSNYVGSNLLGRLLMELRDNENLVYNLPQDTFDFMLLLE